MHLTLGPISYRIRFTQQQLHLNHAPVQAICDHKSRELLINAQLDDDQMKKVIGESVARIWQYRFGTTPAKASIGTNFLEDFGSTRQGLAESA
ncbi:MAG: hypothetical protein JJU36_16285 [Phycisphaeraceae bacterium]|nr:hypothetical protein [Phycisphaeraceae bacterium]